MTAALDRLAAAVGRRSRLECVPSEQVGAAGDRLPG